MNSIGAKPRLDSLTSLRFFAAALVFMRHVQPLLEQAGVNWTAPILLQGTVGVSFFFVLSGFVLMWSHRQSLPVREFYRRRFARVWPNHAVTWVIVVVATLSFGNAIQWPTATVNLAMLQSWFPDSAVYNSINSVSWSLSCEMFFYLCFPLLAPVVVKVRRLQLLAFGLACSLFVVAGVAMMMLPTPDMKVWFVYTFPGVRILEFLLGMVVAQLFLTGRVPKIPMSYALIFVIASYIAAGLVPSRFGLASYAAITAVPFALLIVAAAQNDVAGRSSALHHRWLVKLGDWSFAFYLVHALILVSVSAAFLSSNSSLGQVVLVAAASFILSTVAAWLLHHFVERPCESRLRGDRRRESTLVGTV